jgi:hypothetical protein
VAVGLASITVGFDCPLTNLESWLRRRGAQQPYATGFVDHYVKGRVYPHGHEGVVQVAIAALILAAYAQMLLGRRGRTTSLISDTR